MTSVIHTYGSRKRRLQDTRPPLSSPSSSPPATPPVRRPSKRPFSDLPSSYTNQSTSYPSKRLKPNASATKSKPASKSKKSLTQLHFNIDQTILRTCSLCDLSYTKGALKDELLHRGHCTRVRQGMEWGRDEERERISHSGSPVVEINSNLKLKNSKKVGRIICFPADIGGKIGLKLDTFLQTINLSLSAPDIPKSALHNSKAYIFLLQNESQSHREHIVGCVVAQRISTAMAIIPPESTTRSPTSIVVDSTTNLSCSPTPLRTPMGISRLFVSSSHRRLGIAHLLLDAAAATFIHGCPLDPHKGHIAFSQPTGMGQAVMTHWGCTRVYEA